jgi:uncharacterized DUF497 family protein
LSCTPALRASLLALPRSCKYNTYIRNRKHRTQARREIGDRRCLRALKWDAAKNAANVAKHGIDFDDAVRIFEGPVLEQIDNRRDYGEKRVAVTGIVTELELFVVYTVRGDNRRIISARRASKDERDAYYRAYPRGR